MNLVDGSVSRININEVSQSDLGQNQRLPMNGSASQGALDANLSRAVTKFNMDKKQSRNMAQDATESKMSAMGPSDNGGTGGPPGATQIEKD